MVIGDEAGEAGEAEGGVERNSEGFGGDGRDFTEMFLTSRKSGRTGPDNGVAAPGGGGGSKLERKSDRRERILVGVAVDSCS